MNRPNAPQRFTSFVGPAVWAGRLAFVLTLTAAHTGCAGHGSAARETLDAGAYAGTGVDRYMVMTSPAMLDLEERQFVGWEYGRNDQHLSADQRPALRPDAIGEVVSRQRLWTVNGRPEEFTITTFRSWQTVGD